MVQGVSTIFSKIDPNVDIVVDFIIIFYLTVEHSSWHGGIIPTI